MATYRILGINDDESTCQHCGKTNLKKVVWLQCDDNDPIPVGTTCAARLVTKREHIRKKDSDAVLLQARTADFIDQHRHYDRFALANVLQIKLGIDSKFDAAAKQWTVRGPVNDIRL